MSEWIEDAYAKEWLQKVSERTRKNYVDRFPKDSFNPTRAEEHHSS